MRKAARPVWAVVGERALEALIYLCGFSAIIFVLGIFFFVFKEAFPILGRKLFSVSQFLFSEQWYPTSEVNKRYGVLAMIAGTFSITALSMLIAVPFGLGTAIYLSEFCGSRVREPGQLHRSVHLVPDIHGDEDSGEGLDGSGLGHAPGVDATESCDSVHQRHGGLGRLGVVNFSIAEAGR